MGATRKAKKKTQAHEEASLKELRDFLNEKAALYNTPAFIEEDPIGLPHRYSRKEDIEIAGFFAASLAWGSRPLILRAAGKLLHLMGESPYDFVMEAGPSSFRKFQSWVYRTFQPEDVRFFVLALRHVYQSCGTMENAFLHGTEKGNLSEGIHHFRSVCMQVAHPQRSEKHIADPLSGSAAKRIHLFLRWMVRNDKRGVDFGLWKQISPSILSCPLDVHSGRVARSLGLLSRKQNDAKAVAELDAALRKLDPLDPVKYDFALFGLGVYEEF